MAADVRVRLSAEGVSEVVAALKKIEQEGNRAGRAPAQGFKHLNETLKGTNSLFKQVTAGFTAGAILDRIIARTGQAVRDMIGVLRHWETAWAEVRTIMGGTAAEAEQVEKRVLRLGNIIPKDQASIAKGFYQTISSGITDTGDALFFLNRAAKAATGGISDVFTAVDVGTTILNAYHLQVSETDRIFDVLFTTVKEGKIEFPQLAHEIGTVIPIFANAKVPLEELTAALAALTLGGLPPAEAATALRGMMVAIVKPSEEALTVARQLGIEFNTQAVAAKGLVPWLKEVQDKTKGNSNAIATLFPEVRGMTAVLALAGNQWEQYAGILERTLKQSKGASEDAFNVMNQTLEAQEQILRNRLKTRWIELGQVIVSVSKSALSGVGSLLPATFEEQAEAIRRTAREIERVDTRGQALADTYEQLKAKSDGSKESQRQVKDAMLALAREFPNVITQFDAYGNVIEINTGKLREFRAEQEKVLRGQERSTFRNTADDAENLKEQLERATRAFSSLQEPAVGPRAPLAIQAPEFDQELKEDLRVTIAKLQEELKGKQQDLAKTALESGLAPAVINFDELSKSVDAGTKPVAELDEAIQKLDDRFIALFDTANPVEVKKRMKQVADALRQADPGLSFMPGASAAAGAPAGPAGPSDDELKQAAAARLAAAKSALDQEKILIQGQTKFREEQEEQAFKAGEKSAQAYFAARARIQQEALEREIAAEEKFRQSLANEPDLVKRQSSASDVDERILKLRQQHNAVSAQLAGEEAQETRRLAEERIQLEQQVLEAEGKRHEARMIAIAQEVKAAQALLVRSGAGPEETNRETQRIAAALVTREEFEQVRKAGEQAFSDLEIERGRIQGLVRAGQISELEGEKQTLQAERDRLPVLQQNAQQMLAFALLIKDPELIKSAEELVNNLAGLGVNLDAADVKLRTFGSDMKAALRSDLENWFSSGISGAKNLGDAFRALALSVAQSIQQITGKIIASKIIELLGASFGGGHSIGPLKSDGTFAAGGIVTGPGTGTSDSVAARLSAGEFVVRAAAVAQPGILRHLAMINQGMHTPDLIRPRYSSRFAEGGLVGGGSALSSAARDGRMTIGLEEGLILRALESPAGQKVLVQMIARNKRAVRAATE